MELNVKSFGQGPALVILHGLFGSLDNWVSLARQLEDRFSLYLVDQRNHGKSPHAPNWDYLTMAEDLKSFFDREGIFQAHVLGHSMGGKTAMTFALEYPALVDRLVIADMGVKAYPPHHTEILEALNSVPLAQLQSRQEAEEILSRKIDEISIRQFLLKSLARKEPEGFSWKFNLPVITQNYTRILQAIEADFPYEGPTLFLSGEKSNYVLSEDHDSIRQLFPNAEFVSIPGAGHWLHAEAPEAFLKALTQYLAPA